MNLWKANPPWRFFVQFSSAWCGAAQLEEDPEDDVARTDPWEVFGFRLHPGEEVVCRVHEARTASLVVLLGFAPACLGPAAYSQQNSSFP